MLPSSPSACSCGVRCLSFFFHEGPHLVHLPFANVQVSHEFVMDGPRVAADPFQDAADGIAAHIRQPSRLSNSSAFGQVPHHRDDVVHRESKVEQRRPLSLRESGAARTTLEQPDRVWSVAVPHEQVVRVPVPVERALPVRARQPLLYDLHVRPLRSGRLSRPGKKSYPASITG